MSAHDEVLRKVRRLYTLARATPSEGERLAATQAAERLIQQHRLTQAELGEADEGIANAELTQFPRETWRICLTNALATRYGCALVACGRSWVAFGVQGDIDLLRVQVERITDLIRYTSTRACAGRGRGFLNAYRMGMTAEVIRRLSSDPKPEQGASAGALPATRALVRLDSRSARSEQAREQAFPAACLQRRLPVEIDGMAALHGERDGRELHLGESLVGSPSGLLE